MTADDAVELCRLSRPRTVVPVHYEGWSHFQQGRAAIERVVRRRRSRGAGLLGRSRHAARHRLLIVVGLPQACVEIRRLGATIRR